MGSIMPFLALVWIGPAEPDPWAVIGGGVLLLLCLLGLVAIVAIGVVTVRKK